MSEKFIIEKEFSCIIFKISFLLGINSLYGLYNYLYHNMEYYDVIITNTLVFISSINYWRKPTYGFRRNFDISICLLNLIYNTYTVYEHPVTIFHWISIGGSPLFYSVSWLFYKLKYKKASTFFHWLCHLTANLGSFVIFNGIFTIPIIYEFKIDSASKDTCNESIISIYNNTY